jgi:hypothetical protein
MINDLVGGREFAGALDSNHKLKKSKKEESSFLRYLICAI